MPDILVSVSSDAQRATLMVTANRAANYPCESELIEALHQRGVVSGIDDKAIIEMTAQRICSRPVEIAHGIPPNPGTPGRIEMLIDVSDKGRPKELDDGRVDHHDIRFVINVDKNKPLARRIPPKPGTPGRTVTGQPVPPAPVNDVQIMAGTGTYFAPDNPDLLIAKIAGGISVTPEGRIEIRDQKAIKSDIDYGTGNVKFSGDLYITGSILTGFAVESSGALSVGGRVEDAQLRCGSELHIAGGAVGTSNGLIEAGGSVKIRHLENFTLKSGGNLTVAEDVVHCTIVAEGTVSAKNIIGGVTAAGDGIKAESIGSAAEPRTVVDIGMRYVRARERYELLRNLGKETSGIAVVNEQMYILVRDSMNDAGELNGQAMITLDNLKKKRVESSEKCRKMQERIEMIDKLDSSKPSPVIEAGVIFPNTIIKYGENERTIKEKLLNVKFSPNDAKPA